MDKNQKSLILISKLLVISFTSLVSSAQSVTVEHTYAKTLIGPIDSFGVRFSYLSFISQLKFADKDTIDIGGDGAKTRYLDICRRRR